MPRKTSGGRDVAPAGKPARADRKAVPAIAEVATTAHRFGRELVPDVAIHRTNAIYIPSSGPWDREAGKYAWWDRGTGLACIIRREEHGNLAGYVAVPRGHPLHGLEVRALPPGLDIEVHGGLNHAAPCDRREPEDRSVCHVPETRLDAVGGPRLGAHEDLWWFGFSCDKPYDHVPRYRRNAPVAATGQVYRDEAYVHRQVVQLAEQLDAIGRGLPKPPPADRPPPIATPVLRREDRR